MKIDLIEFAEHCPDVTISVKLGDLIEANRGLINETKKELKQEAAKASEESFLTREETMKFLGVSSTTLWRWSKIGYLIPVYVGVKRLYRMSDINKILRDGKEF